MTVGLTGLIILAIASQVLARPHEGSRWLETFEVWPGAEQLCGQHVLGESAGEPVEIEFTLYGTASEPAEVARFYAEAHDVRLEPGAQTVSIRPHDGLITLTVQPVSARFPDCGVSPEPHHRAVIVVSSKGALAPANEGVQQTGPPPPRLRRSSQPIARCSRPCRGAPLDE